jgi:hypothetical protein
MNSLTLKEKGITEFIPLKELTFSAIPANKACVIVLADKTLAGKPTSDILYIGRTKKPSKRIFGGYLSGYGGKTTKKINTKLFEEGYLEKTTVSWVISSDTKATQKELLEAFKKEHGTYPAWNKNKNSEKPQSKPQQASKTPKTQPPAIKPTKPVN